MRKLIFAISCVCLAALVSCSRIPGSGKLKTDVDSASYAYGVFIGKGLQQSELTHFKAEFMKMGLEDVLSGKNDTMDYYAAVNIMNAYYEKYQQTKTEERYADVRKAGEEFLAKNREAEGVQTTGSGLQYIVIEEGNGPKPAADDVVLVHYKGTLVDGTVFESSRDNSEAPVPLNVNSVIPGWTEALLMMNTGSVWKIFLPYDLAYGTTERAGSPIKPYSALIFEIELVGISPKE